jgi:GTP 3',8-cyclase
LPVLDRLNRPLLDLRISVIDACNFRCTYCMPAEVFGASHAFLREDQLLSFDEIERVARLFVGLGVRKIKLTGGEPLLRPWLPDLVHRLAGIEGLGDLALITNGLLLAGLAGPLRKAGLARATVSLDSLRDDCFGAMNGRGYRVAQVLRGIDAAAAAGLGPLKLNTVVIRGVNDGEVLDLVAFARERGATLRLIEYMDVGNTNGWRREQVVPSDELLARITARYPAHAVAPHMFGEVASRYRFDDGRGEIGFISSVSRPFCGACTRARLSADGRIYTCLFGAHGVDLRGPLRDGASDAELVEAIRGTWGRRDDRYSEERGAATPGGQGKVEMHYIGG